MDVDVGELDEHSHSDQEHCADGCAGQEHGPSTSQPHLPSRGDALLALGFLEDRDECRGQGAFSKKSAEQVGDLEGQEKGVGHGAGAHEGRVGGFTDEPENSTQQRCGTGGT